MVGSAQGRTEIHSEGWEPATPYLNPFGGTKRLMTKRTYPGQPGNLNATPSEVSPTLGSSTQAPGGGYPSNPMDAARTNDNIAKGIPATPDYFAMGIEIMAPCPLGCGVAVSERTVGEHIQDHAVAADQAALARGDTTFGQEYEI